jgi:hypothetical protein
MFSAVLALGLGAIHIEIASPKGAVAEGSWIAVDLNLVAGSKPADTDLLSNDRSFVCYRCLPDKVERCLPVGSTKPVFLRQVDPGLHTLEMWLEAKGETVAKARNDFVVEKNSEPRGQTVADVPASRVRVKRTILGQLLAFNTVDTMVGRSLDLMYVTLMINWQSSLT